MQKNIKIFIWIIASIIVVITVILIFSFNNKQTTNQKVIVEPIPASKPVSTKSVTKTNTKIETASIAYADALVKYANTRIQLDTACQAHPSNVTYKDNIGIMIDNRSPETRTVKVGTTFTIKPWGFKIVVLPDVYLTSKTILVNCDQRKNIATILIQE